VVMPDQEYRERKGEQHHNPHNPPIAFLSGVRRRNVADELVVRADDGMLVCVSGQKEAPYSASKRSRIVLLVCESARLKLHLQPKGDPHGNGEN
jgi:hypothetical protein